MKGFTLLEVLIATALTAVILVAVYGAYVTNTDTIQAAREASRMQQTARILFDLMAKDVRCALRGDFQGVEGGMRGMDLEVQGRPADRLQMLTSASHAGVAGVTTGLYKVLYEMAVNEEGDGFILYRTQEAMFGEAASADLHNYELTRMATGLDLRFQDAEGREFESWGTGEGQQGGALPSLVQVKLTLKGSSGQERVFVTSLHPESAGGASVASQE